MSRRTYKPLPPGQDREFFRMARERQYAYKCKPKRQQPSNDNQWTQQPDGSVKRV